MLMSCGFLVKNEIMYLGTGREGENHSYNGVYDSIIGKSKTE